MNVIVEIDGREAIPVRAIPLLTDWKVMSPDMVAKALAWDEFYFDFDGLCAYRIEGGITKAIKATWWEGFAVRGLKALSERIKAEQVTHDAGYQKWRKESLTELPAGVFVWKDEYVPMYESRYGPDALAHQLGRELTQSERQARELDFDPFVSPEHAALVKENFAYQQHAPVQQAGTVPAPVVMPASEPVPAIKKGGYVLRRSAAIKKYSATWETIDADFRHASENGLTEAAKATKHGDWYETALLAWADQKGKRTEPKQSREIVNSIFDTPGRVHTTKP